MRRSSTPTDKMRSRARAIRAGVAVGALTPLAATGLGTQLIAGASPSSSPSSTVGTPPVSPPGTVSQLPLPPGTGATSAEWQSWSRAYAQALELVPWSQDLANDGCTLDNVSYLQIPMASENPDAPPGVNSTGVAILGHCPPGVTPPTMTQGGLPLAFAPPPGASPASRMSKLYPASFPVGGACNQSARIGNLCAVLGPMYGADYSIDSTQYNTSGASQNGHIEISNIGLSSTCSPQSAIKNTADTTIPNGSFLTLQSGPYGTEFVSDSTFWKSPSPYQDWGDVCTSF